MDSWTAHRAHGRSKGVEIVGLVERQRRWMPLAFAARLEAAKLVADTLQFVCLLTNPTVGASVVHPLASRRLASNFTRIRCFNKRPCSRTSSIISVLQRPTSLQNATWPMNSNSHGLQMLHVRVSIEWGHRYSTVPDLRLSSHRQGLNARKCPDQSAKTSPLLRETVCSQQRVCC